MISVNRTSYIALKTFDNCTNITSCLLDLALDFVVFVVLVISEIIEKFKL